MDIKPNKVFVYGILQSPEQKDATLNGYIRFFRGHASISKSRGSKIRGKLIENVTKEMMEEFDRIEGVKQNYYHRFIVTVETEEGTEHEAWVYQQVKDKEE